MHAAVARHYFDGGSFPVGGSSQIAKTIDTVIEKAGGTILISADVEEIIISSHTATGVKMKDGKIFSAKNIISGAGIMTTYNRLISTTIAEKYKLKNQLQKVNRSVSHACLYLGLEGSPEELQLPKTNYWIYPSDLDHDASVDRYLANIEEEFPVVYISFPSAKDPDWNKRYPGKSTIDIITLVPYEFFESWDGSKWMKRGEDYTTLKEKITQRLLEVLYKRIPQAKGKIAHYELSTPLTTKHFINYDKGEIYGLDHSPKRFRQEFLKPKTPIKNLYLTGQDIVTAGVAAALFSGVITSAAMTGKNIMKKVMAN
jgi:all-trans-retinol 13,14-reductase